MIKTKDKIFIILICVLIAFFLFILNPSTANSESDYFFFRKYIGQPIDKEWTVRFNQPIDYSTTGGSAIQIKNDNNEIIPLEIILSENERELNIKGNWGYGESYTLYIKDIKSKTDKPLSRNIMMPFSIIDKGQYRFELIWNKYPADLDLNLMLPDEAIVNSRNPAHEKAELDMDIVSGFGAENILLKQVEKYNLYKIYVTSFTPLTDSNATVNVYNDEGLLRSFALPDNWNKNKWIACYMYGDLLIVGERY